MTKREGRRVRRPKRRTRLPRWASSAGRVAAAAVVLIALGAVVLSRVLVHVDPPRRADAVVLVGSDARGSGEEWAASLVRRGFARLVILADEPAAWGVTTGDIWSRHLARLGVPPNGIALVPTSGTSPWADADAMGAALSRRGLKAVIVVCNRIDTGRLRFINGRAWRRYGIRTLYCPFPPDPGRNQHGRVRDRAIGALDLLLDLFWRK